MLCIKGEDKCKKIQQIPRALNSDNLQPLFLGAARARLWRRARAVLEGGGHREAPPIDIKALHAKIGELTLENDFLEGALIGVLSFSDW